MRSSDVLALAAVLASGCFSPIDLSGRRCPCDEGWVCDEARDRCVEGERDAGTDANASDAGQGDAGQGDAGQGDAGEDAGGDAGAFDAGSVDARDAGTDAGSSFSPCPVGARLCDDFESDVANRIPPWEWSNEAPSRTTTRAFRGGASGHFRIPGGPAIIENNVGIDMPRTTREVYLRFWTYVPSTANPQNLAVVVLGDGTAPDFFNHSVVVNSGSWGMYNSVSGLYVEGANVPDDTWTCVVFHAVLGTTGRLELLIDGEAPIVSDGDTFFPAGPVLLGMGITYADASQTLPFDLFYDDVAITLDGTALTCP